MIYITGDTHGNFSRFVEFCEKNNTSTDDIMIILGDAGLNYYTGKRDKKLKEKVSALPITFFCIHGNHEMRPATISTYITKKFCGGEVWYEEKYPNLLFTKDGDVYEFNGQRCLVIGGAYSVDKFYRLANGWSWFPDEQPSADVKARVEKVLARESGKVDIVLSHTCPLKYEPVEVFLPYIDQSKVDKTTEIWLGKVEASLDYKKWYCGHFHTEKVVDRIEFMFESIKPFFAV